MRNTSPLSILTAVELLTADPTPPVALLAPLLASDTTALVYGPSGIGKSFFALGIAWAVASGGSFLGWRSPREHRVLYLDGEMGSAELRARLALFGPPPPALTVSTPDLGIGQGLDLSETAGVGRLMKAWNDPELVVIDTLSTLASSGSGDPERWDKLQRFLQHQRLNRRAVLMVHHANKEGALHGAARRENVLDLMIALRRPDAAIASGNARFEIHFEKTRRHRGAPLMPMLAELQTVDGQGHWRFPLPEAASKVERVAALLNRGLTAREASKALGISRSSLFKFKALARVQDLLTGGKS